MAHTFMRSLRPMYTPLSMKLYFAHSQASDNQLPSNFVVSLEVEGANIYIPLYQYRTLFALNYSI